DRNGLFHNEGWEVPVQVVGQEAGDPARNALIPVRWWRTRGATPVPGPGGAVEGNWNVGEVLGPVEATVMRALGVGRVAKWMAALQAAYRDAPLPFRLNSPDVAGKDQVPKGKDQARMRYPGGPIDAHRPFGMGRARMKEIKSGGLDDVPEDV